MAIFMKETGGIIISMELELSFFQIEEFIMDNMLTENQKVKARFIGAIKKVISENGLMERRC
jgi:hypothetical protein